MADWYDADLRLLHAYHVFGDAIAGILSLNDVVRVAGQRPGVAGHEVIETLQAICGGHHPAPHVVAV